jgi:hypothetical protein
MRTGEWQRRHANISVLNNPEITEYGQQVARLRGYADDIFIQSIMPVLHPKEFIRCDNGSILYSFGCEGGAYEFTCHYSIKHCDISCFEICYHPGSPEIRDFGTKRSKEFDLRDPTSFDQIAAFCRRQFDKWQLDRKGDAR